MGNCCCWELIRESKANVVTSNNKESIPLTENKDMEHEILNIQDEIADIKTLYVDTVRKMARDVKTLQRHESIINNEISSFKQQVAACQSTVNTVSTQHQSTFTLAANTNEQLQGTKKSVEAIINRLDNLDQIIDGETTEQ